MNIKISDNNKNLLISITAGLMGNLLAYLSSMITPMQPQVIFDFSHIATFAVAVALGPIYGLLTGEEPQVAVNLGWAHGALMTTFPGDTTMATLEQVRAFARGGSARIQR